jgi:hypothetical protein
MLDPFAPYRPIPRTKLLAVTALCVALVAVLLLLSAY